MTEEIMPREDRTGKILTFLGGCLAGVIGVFTVAAMSEFSDMSSRTLSSGDSENGDEQDETLVLSDSSVT
jgi:hypothetical protein